MDSWQDVFDAQERALLRSLRTPQRIQDFLDTIPMNFRDTCYSPRMVLRNKRAHCMEGAMLAAVALRFAGYPPLVMDLKSVPHDDDHVVSVFQQNGHWGAISKTNHGVLRYREPVYESIRELAMSYFHEYFLDDGSKTLRSYSRPVDLSRFDRRGWMTDAEGVEYVPEYVDGVRHIEMLSRGQIARLRKSNIIERKMGRIIEWSR